VEEAKAAPTMTLFCPDYLVIGL